MMKVCHVALSATVLALLAAGGCKEGSHEPSRQTANVERLLADLSRSIPEARMAAAEQLAKLPPTELRKILPDLQKASSKEQNPQVRKSLQTAVIAAGADPAR